MAGERYLKPNVILEPLVDRWFAWPYLISPATAAMYTANLHTKLMESFISDPQVHIAAASNPALRGGPYMRHDETKVGAVKALLDETKNKRRRALDLADAIKALDSLLTAEAQGYSMEPLYQKVPEPLKGYVELYYDLNNRPAVRFMEALLYKSKYNEPAAQSIFLRPAEGDYRHFVFSTPRLDGERGCFLNLPFSHAGLDE